MIKWCKTAYSMYSSLIWSVLSIVSIILALGTIYIIDHVEGGVAVSVTIAVIAIAALLINSVVIRILAIKKYDWLPKSVDDVRMRGYDYEDLMLEVVNHVIVYPNSIMKLFYIFTWPIALVCLWSDMMFYICTHQPFMSEFSTWRVAYPKFYLNITDNGPLDVALESINTYYGKQLTMRKFVKMIYKHDGVLTKDLFVVE